MASKTMRLLVKGEAVIGEAAPLEDTRFSGALSASIRQKVALNDIRGAAQESIDVDPDDVLELSLEDGLRIYTSARQFEVDFLEGGSARDGQQGVVVPQRIGAGDASRGLVGFVLKRIGVVDVETAAAESISDLIKNKIESVIVGERDALYALEQLRRVDTLGATRVAPQSRDAFNIDHPILLFIHGTASSTRGSFSDLWEKSVDQTWKQITDLYPPENIVGFEHRTLSLSPIENTVNVLKALPKGARLHLVSHSRGGIVGELLCRGQLAEERVPFSDEDLEFFNPEVNSGLRSLIDTINSEHGSTREKRNPYARQRELLQQLNGLFREKEIRVERFVRVACPARGTTLASNRLDTYLSTLLNVIGFIPVLKASAIYGMVKSLLLAVVKQKSRAEQIPGLEAQMPGSPTMQMLNNIRGSSLAPLAVIEGDIEPRGIFKKIAMLLVDRFYKGEHDLVVNTPSMDGGTRRRFGIHALSLRGAEVNHFSYFANSDSRSGVLNGLRAQRPDGFIERLQKPKVIARSLPPSRASGEVPAVFILPGILGSELAAGDDHIWVDKLGLIWGGFGELEIGNPEVTAVKPLVSAYGALADYLGETHEVIPFAYDWRRSIAVGADRLKVAVEEYLQGSHQPLRFVAHSMGGLVVRAMIARHPQVWDEVCRRPGSRVLMLGTPNDGSHSMVRVLLGEEKLIKYLALVDLRHSEAELINIFRRFPGVLELLPRESGREPGASRDFFSSGIWSQIKPLADKGWSPPTAADLRAADRFWREIERQPLDSQRIFYIAGQADATPMDVMVGEGEVKVRSTARGDGRVPWEGGIPEGIQHWYLDVAHGDLANHAPGFKGILEILETGGTLAFSGRPPVIRGKEASREMPPDNVEFLPDDEELIRAALGSVTAQSIPETGSPPVEISVVHGDLCFIDLPVAVGHYTGDEIVSAEGVLDRQLQGRLNRRYQLGLYPGAVGSHEIVIEAGENGLTGAIVVGLGEVGGLTPGRLTASMRAAVKSYALKMAEEPVVPGIGIQFACLLIGSGSGGITMENVLNSIIQGVLEANDELTGDTWNRDRLIQRVSFVELYEDRALLAQHVLNQISRTGRYNERILAGRQVRQIEGGLRRAFAQEHEGWWPRIRIESGERGALSFTVIDQGARVPMEITQTQRCSVEPFLRNATSSIYTSDRVGRVLFELLIPTEFKHHAPERRNLVLLVDRRSAIYPWELLEYPVSGKDRALAAEASLVRQLVSPGSSHGVANAWGRLLVVADPDLEGSDYPQLPGAAKEGQTVADMFGVEALARRFDPKVLLNKRGTEIIRSLMTDQIRVLHISGHGVVQHTVRCADDDPPEQMTGVLIGRNHVLTAAEINQMPSIPQLAFINCCHLGRVDDKENQALDRPNLLAADFGVSLIERGVRAVVVAGWAVQDAAAEVFAQSFYREMLAGRNFGESVKEARSKTRSAYPQFNTWGAYQCYGDPGFKLDDRGTGNSGSSAPRMQNFVSKGHCRILIDNIAAQAKTAAAPDKLSIRLEGIVDEMPKAWLADADIQVGLARAWGELGAFSKAIEAYQASCRGEKPAASVGDLEQLANLRVRHAARLADSGDAGDGRRSLTQGIDSLKELNEHFGHTIERMNLLGSAYKRLALFSGPATKARVKSLHTACDCYREANRLSLEQKHPGTYAYPLINMLTLGYLLRYYGSDYPIEHEVTDAGLDELAERYDPDQELTRESFWNAITANEVRFVKSLIQDTLDGETAAAVTARYIEIRRLAASPRQMSSVVEHIRLLHRLAEEASVVTAKGSRGLEARRRQLVEALGTIINQLLA